MKEKLPSLIVDDENAAEIAGNPLHMLLLYVLERALRDLTHREKLIRSEAVQWFIAWKNALPECVSYKDVRDNVDLSAEYIIEIRRRVNKAMMDELI
jgi:hypothetical protein